MVKGMKAHHIGMEHPPQDLFSAIQLTEDLTGGEGDMQKEDLACNATTVPAHLPRGELFRKQGQVIIMDP